MELLCREATRSGRGRPHANAARHKRGTCLTGNRVLVDGEPHRIEQRLGILARDARGSEIDQAQVVIGPTGHESQAACRHPLAKCRSVLDHVVDIRLELGAQGLAKGHRLTRNHMHERTALRAGEHRLVNGAGKLVVVGEDKAAARAAQGLVARRGDDIGMRKGRRMRARRDQAGDMRHIYHEAGTHTMRDGCDALKIDSARVGGGASHDQRRVLGLGQSLELVIVDGLSLERQAVGNEVIQFAREVHRAAVGEMAAMVEAHAEDRVARLHKGRVGRQIGVCAAVGLHIGMLASEQPASALAGQVLHHVDLLASAVVTMRGVAFGILVGEHAAHCLEHGRTGEILGGDEFDASALAGELPLDRLRDGGVAVEKHAGRGFKHVGLRSCDVHGRRPDSLHMADGSRQP